MIPPELNTELHLILLPGLDGTGKLFAPFLDQFSDNVNVTVITYPMQHHIPFAQLADYIIPLLPKDQSLVILGESYSGPVALSLAARNDIDIRGVILVATFAQYPPSLLKSIAQWLPLSLLFRLPIPEIIIQNFCFGTDTNKMLSSLLRNSVRENKPDILARRARDGASINVTKLLSTIKVPCLYIAASHDKLVTRTAIDILKRQLANLDVVTIEGTHFILQVQPAACFKVINEFISNIHIKK